MNLLDKRNEPNSFSLFAFRNYRENREKMPISLHCICDVAMAQWFSFRLNVFIFHFHSSLSPSLNFLLLVCISCFCKKKNSISVQIERTQYDTAFDSMAQTRAIYSHKMSTKLRNNKTFCFLLTHYARNEAKWNARK